MYRLSCLLFLTPFVACSESLTDSPVGRVSLTVSPLSLPGVTDACYTLSVANEANQTVWTEPGLCASQFGASGGLTFVGSCDATDTNGGGAVNTVTLVIDDLYGSGGAVLTDYQDPCASPHSPGGCKLTALCVENADTPVTFNLTVLREANQGFFDVGVSFADIFCSAKVDCEQGAGAPLMLLHNPATGARGTTAVVALACTSGPGAEGTVLLRDPIEVKCGATTTLLDPAAARGNVYGTGPGQMVDPNSSDAIWQYAVYAGDESLDCGGVSCQKQYWNIAIGFDATVADCTLKAKATAVGASSFSSFATPVGTTYPVVVANVRLTSAATPVTRVCSRHPVNGSPAGVSTSYTSPGGGVTFTAAFDGSNLTRPAVLMSGFGSDGSVTVSSTVALNQQVLAAGRTSPDAVGYKVTGISGSAVTLSSSATGILAGDEVIVWNAHGTAAANSAVGRWEFGRVASVSGTVVTLTTNLANVYGQTSNTNLSGQDIVLQRVPNYTNVTVTSSGQLTVSGWNGTTGGLLAFRASGVLSIASGGRVHSDAKGYISGAYGTIGDCDAYQGSSWAGTPVGGVCGGSYNVSVSGWNPNFGGGGALITGAGGNHAGGATNADSWTGGVNAPLAGLTYGVADLSKLYFGSGGGGVYRPTTSAQPGADGGGALIVYANEINAPGTAALSARGGSTTAWSQGSYTYGAGGGAGGSILLAAQKMSLGNDSVDASGGSGTKTYIRKGGDGGRGRIRLDFGTLNSFARDSASATSAAQAAANPDPGHYGTP